MEKLLKMEIQKENQITFSDLPEEIISKIISYLSFRDMALIGLLSTSINNIVEKIDTCLLKRIKDDEKFIK